MCDGKYHLVRRFREGPRITIGQRRSPLNAKIRRQ
jgi:hypothetical protein